MVTVEEEEPPLPVDIVDEEFIDETKLIEQTEPPRKKKNPALKRRPTTTSTTTTTSTSMLKAAHIDNVGRNRSPRTTTKANHVRIAKTTTARAHIYTTSKSPKLVRKTTTSKPKAQPKWKDHWQRFANMFYGFGGYRH